MSKRRNTFSRALRQLKSEEIDKKIQLTETLPTNNTMGVFISMPPGAVVSTTTVQRTYWDQASLDLDVDGQSDGKDTTGLFETDGTPKTAMPSGDTSYILGPMSAMYYGWWSGGTTTIGYIRQSDRKMVNLGTISGKLHEWDGSSFNSYGQLTLEQAVWFRDVKKKDDAGNDPANANYRAFYPGPPSNTPDAFGRYYCTVTGEPLNRSVTSNVEVPHSPTEKGEISPNDAFSAIMDRIRQGKKLSKAEQEFLRDRNSGQRGWLGNAMENIRNSLSNSVPAALGRALRSLTDPIRYAGQNMFQGNPAGRSAGLSNYWSPDPRTAGTYSRTGNLRGVPGARPGPGGTITTAPRPRNIPRVSRSPLGQPQFKFPKGTSVRNMVTSVADDAAMSAAGRTAATRIGSRLGRVVPFVGATIAVADATSRISNGDYGGAILSAASAIPGPLGWIALGTQMVTDGIGATGNRREEYIIETKTKDTFRDEFQKMGGFDIEKGDWGAAFLDELAKTSEIKDDEKSIIAAVFSGEDEGIMITDLQETLGKIMVRIANKEYKGKKPDVQETISESKKASRVLKNLKNPVVIPETKQKKYKVKPGARMRGMDKLIGDIKPQESYKEPQKIWSKNSQGYNARSSQEKKNQVLQYVGASMDHWDYMTDTVKKQGGKIMANYKDHDYLYDYWLGGTRKKAVRKEEVKGDYVVFLDDGTSMLQSSYNEKIEQEKEKEMFDEYYKLNPKNEPIPYENDPLFKKVSKRLKPVIDYPEKPAKKGYPNEPPPKMVNGWHPEYGQRYKYDKLDPVSAKAMPPTGNPEIDANVEKTKAKPK